MSRVTPRVAVTRNSPNQSSRNGVRPRLIVLHSTESDNITGSRRDLENVADFLCRPATQASAHVMVDSDGQSARMVPDDRKAWHCAGYNSVSLGVEQIGRAASEHWTEPELWETCRWIARWSKQHAIPIRLGAVANGTVTRSGVVTHKMLGATGGGHGDPGPHYPLEKVLRHARYFRGLL